MTDEREAWIALAAVPGVGPVVLDRMRSHYGSLSVAIAALADPSSPPGRSRRMRWATVSAATIEAITAAARDPDRPVREMAALDGWVVTPFDTDYQRWLHAIEEPPTLLFGIGRREPLCADRSVAIVGTRHPTALGTVLATRVAIRLVEAGVSVVSGLAVGIDAAAHAGALDGHGSTIAVVGGGIDQPGPAANRRLADRILACGGTIISEHRPGVRPTRGTFPRRNRIISALALGTIVIEAPARSGALITARHALEQGRRLIVAPGRPGDPATAGCLALLRESPATPLVGLDELIVDLGLDAAVAEGAPTGAGLSAEAALETLTPVQRQVAEALMQGARTADAIVADLGMEPGVVAAALTLLQLRGWAQVHGSIQLAIGPLA